MTAGTVSDLAITEMACSPEKTMEAEAMTRTTCFSALSVTVFGGERGEPPHDVEPGSGRAYLRLRGVSVCPPCQSGISSPNHRKDWKMRTGGIGGSLFLVALGAILYWAVTVEAEGFNLNTMGVILMVVGVVGLILTLIMTASAERTEREDKDVTIVER